MFGCKEGPKYRKFMDEGDFKDGKIKGSLQRTPGTMENKEGKT